MVVLRILSRCILLLLHVLKLWLWVIPTRLTVFAIALYFGIMYLLFDTVHPPEIKEQLGDNKWAYLFGFILPFGLPLFLAFISIMAHGKNSQGSLHDAIQFRNSQMRIKPPKEASKILQNTSMLDLMENSNDDVMESAKRGFEAQYGNSSPTKVFKDMMDENA